MEEIRSLTPRRHRQNWHLTKTEWNKFFLPANSKGAAGAEEDKSSSRAAALIKLLTLPSFLPPTAGGVKRRSNTQQQDDKRHIQRLGFIERKVLWLFFPPLSPCQKNQCQDERAAGARSEKSGGGGGRSTERRRYQHWPPVFILMFSFKAPTGLTGVTHTA